MIRDKVFISYSHADKKWLNLLMKHLKPLIKEDLNVWSDQDILPGQQWSDEIDKSLASAKVAVLLLSADFLASDFIQDKEVPRFLSPAMNGQVIILPVLISPCLWDRTKICSFQSPINPKVPLQSLRLNEREQALVDIATAIESAWKRQACGQSFPEEEASRVALEQFRALAVRHASMSAERVEDGFRRAVRVCHADSSLQEVFPKLSTQQALGWTALNDFFTEKCRPEPALVQALAAELAAPVSQPLNPREGASTSSVLQALKKFVDTLIQAIEPSRFDDLLADMQEEEIGRAIVKTLTAGSHESRCKRLVQNSAKYDEAGFDVLWNVLDINVDPSLAIRPRLEKAFAAYRDEKRKEAQSCQPRLSSCLEDQAREGKILRGRLDDLARNHSRVEAEKLQRAVASALRESYQAQLPVNMIPSIFDSGPITDWSDLLRRTAGDPFPLDQRFLDALEAALTNPSPEDGSSHALALASLIVMVLEPTDLMEGESCKKYAFRAFLCPGENATPAEWISLDAKDPGYPIPAEGFVEGLQALLCQALERALVQVPSTSEPLLLEIFLPAEYLNLDIGSKIRLPVPGEKSSGPIARDYPVVLRSSDRYQRFHERRAKTLQTPLPAKWDWARSATSPAEPRCRWWQDPPPTSEQGLGSLIPEKDSATTEDRMDALHELFAKLRARQEFFSFRRITNLPTCPQTLQTWLNQVINACPPVAIWWRPGAQSSDAQREESLRFWQEESRRGSALVKSLEKQLVDKKKLAHNDPFFHPHVTTPLKLFHALASAIFRGRYSDDHSLAFKEVVLLMDSVERWPPRRDFEPLFERKSVQGVTVVNVSEEGLLRVSDLPP